MKKKWNQQDPIFSKPICLAHKFIVKIVIRRIKGIESEIKVGLFSKSNGLIKA